MLKLKKHLRVYLERQSEKTGKTMVRIVEELLEYHGNFKTPAAGDFNSTRKTA